MTRDRLFLLQPGFEDPAYPGRCFYCWHCALIEGVLASFPLLAKSSTSSASGGSGRDSC